MPATTTVSAVVSPRQRLLARAALVKVALENRDDAVERALVILHDRQTDVERMSRTTTEHNGVGFSGFDAEFLSSLAEQVKENRYGRPMGRRLTERQRGMARAKVMKYAKQLASAAIEREDMSPGVLVVQGNVLVELTQSAAAALAPAGPVGRAVAQTLLELNICPSCGGSRREDIVDRDGEYCEIACRRCG